MTASSRPDRSEPAVSGSETLNERLVHHHVLQRPRITPAGAQRLGASRLKYLCLVALANATQLQSCAQPKQVAGLLHVKSSDSNTNHTSLLCVTLLAVFQRFGVNLSGEPVRCESEGSLSPSSRPGRRVHHKNKQRNRGHVVSIKRAGVRKRARSAPAQVQLAPAPPATNSSSLSLSFDEQNDFYRSGDAADCRTRDLVEAEHAGHRHNAHDRGDRPPEETEPEWNKCDEAAEQVRRSKRGCGRTVESSNTYGDVDSNNNGEAAGVAHEANYHLCRAHTSTGKSTGKATRYRYWTL